MVMRDAVNPGADSLANNIHPRINSSSLWDRGSILVSPNDRNIGDWRFSSPSARQETREREILEQLLNFLDPASSPHTASNLLQEFGSLNAALSASFERKEDRPIFAFLSLVQEAMIESSKSKILNRICLSNSSEVIEYLIIAMAHLPVEEVRVLYLDSKNRLIRDEVTGRGTVSEAPIYPREILKRALTLEATGLILAHNHPSGDPEPSDCDIRVTHRLAVAGKEIGVLVHDHIVVGRCGWVSLSQRGQI